MHAHAITIRGTGRSRRALILALLAAFLAGSIILAGYRTVSASHQLSGAAHESPLVLAVWPDAAATQTSATPTAARASDNADSGDATDGDSHQATATTSTDQHSIDENKPAETSSTPEATPSNDAASHESSTNGADHSSANAAQRSDPRQTGEAHASQPGATAVDQAGSQSTDTPSRMSLAARDGTYGAGSPPVTPEIASTPHVALAPTAIQPAMQQELNQMLAATISLYASDADRGQPD